MRAKTAIKKIVGIDSKFVRATYGHTDANCMQVYSQNKLKRVYWDIVSSDDSETADCASVRNHIETETERLATGTVDLIYLLHDINQVTAEHLTDSIDVIATSVRTNVIPYRRRQHG
jgi:hypothetical protein